MDPLAIPTDNTYKMMAISGLVLAGFGVWLYIRAFWLIFELPDWGARKLASVQRFRRNLGMDRGERLQLQAEVIKGAELGKLFESAPEMVGFVTKAIVVVGLLLSSSGFYLWWTRVQIHQDVTVQAAAREQVARAELAELELARVQSLAESNVQLRAAGPEASASRKAPDPAGEGESRGLPQNTREAPR